eukprot:14979918-Ditylum_brightwellii.AAC.1
MKMQLKSTSIKDFLHQNKAPSTKEDRFGVLKKKMQNEEKSKRIKHASTVTTSVPFDVQNGLFVLIVAADTHKKNILQIKIGDSDDIMPELIDRNNNTNSDDSNFEDKDNATEKESSVCKLPKIGDLKTKRSRKKAVQ